MPPLSRRRFLIAGVAAAAGVACSPEPPATSTDAGPALTTTTAAATTSPGTAPAPPATRAGTSMVPSTARFVVRGPERDEVALTFHTDGDPALVRRLLAVLADHGTTMTAFVVGRWLAANPALGRALVEAGHELGNHTSTHPSFTTLHRAAMDTEITRCRDQLIDLTGSGGRFFRPSGFDDGTEAPSAAVLDAAAAAGYAEVAGFDVDPLDHRDPGAAVVTRRTLEAVRAGSVVSLHCGHRGTVDALPAILDGLRDRGLRPVTLDRLLR